MEEQGAVILLPTFPQTTHVPEPVEEVVEQFLPTQVRTEDCPAELSATVRRLEQFAALAKELGEDHAAATVKLEAARKQLAQASSGATGTPSHKSHKAAVESSALAYTSAHDDK